jgi:hypothetical protein
MNQLRNSAAAPNSYVLLSDNHPEKFANFLVLASIPHKAVDGCYKSQQEPAWLINLADLQSVLDRYPSIADQESVLVLGPLELRDGVEVRPAVLRYDLDWCDQSDDNAGWFWPVSEAAAMAQDGWTRDGDQYYTCSFAKPADC